jgi:Ring finger domain
VLQSEIVEMPLVDSNQESLLKQLLPSRILTEQELEQLLQSHATNSCIAPVDGASKVDAPTLDEPVDEKIDLEAQSKKEENDTTNDLAVACSICLHELSVGQNVYESGCNHWFHAECIRQWVVVRRRSSVLVSGNNHCPNCRAEIVSDAPLEEILCILRRRQALGASSANALPP